jgi:hypothetical protein
VEAAAAEVARRLERDPHSSALWRLAAEIAALRGDEDAAARAAVRAADLDPPDDDGR